MDRDTTMKQDADWLPEAGLSDNDRHHLGRAVGDLSEPFVTPRSEVACQVSGQDLYLFRQLFLSLRLDREEPLHRKLHARLVEAGRCISRLRLEDIKAEIRHQAEVSEVEADRVRDRRVTRSALYDALAKLQSHRQRLSALSSDAAMSGSAQAARARLDHDFDWAHEQIKELR